MMSKDKYYRYALGYNGNIIHISEVNKDNRRNKYYCISCGCELVPVLGENNAHHFRHKTDTCGYESYLHKLAKKRLLHKFDICETFEIATQQRKTCNKLNICPFGIEDECSIPEEKIYDLKKNGLYDLCQDEKPVLNGRFVADILITDTDRKRTPLLIEICVTHKSSEEKRNSGLPIIEIYIEREEQIDDLITHPIGYNDSTYKCEKINFKHLSNNHCVPLDIMFPLSKFIVYNSGKSFFLRASFDYQNKNNSFDCSKIDEIRKDNALIEIAIPPFVSDYNLPLYYCYQRNIKTCYCSLCYFSTDSNNGLVCTLFKTKGTPHYPKNEQVVNCRFFKIDSQIEHYLSSKIENTPIIELPVSF